MITFIVVVVALSVADSALATWAKLRGYRGPRWHDYVLGTGFYAIVRSFQSNGEAKP